LGVGEAELALARPSGPSCKAGVVDEVVEGAVNGEVEPWRKVEVLIVDCEGVLIGLGGPMDGSDGGGWRLSV
jgi:hypothetical protein